MSFPPTRLLFAAAFLAGSLLCTTSRTHAAESVKVDFESQILPILDTACFKCHSARSRKVKGDTRLDELVAIRAKSRTSSLVFPRKPEKSLLFKVINLPAGDEDVMPPPDEGKPLPADQIALIRKWLEEGADFGHWKSTAPRAATGPVIVATGGINAADVAGTARHIDELIEAALTRAGKKPNAPEADDLWCRRVYLDLIGRIPSYDEIDRYLGSHSPQKRPQLIEQLLASNGHVSTMTNYWADALRARDRLAENVRGDFYLHYVKENIRTNKPYDKWVREMVSPEGSLWESPAVGYHLRDLGNRFASVDNTATLFLGTQIGCAQCHDHPYDEWSRKAYHQFAAWTSALESQRKQMQTNISAGDLSGLEEKLEKITGRRTTSARKQMANSLSMEILRGMTSKLGRNVLPDFSLRNGAQTAAKLPADYKYADGTPNEPILPAVLFGEAHPQPGQRPADVFANWLTSPENPRFALTIANRMWARIMGAPFTGTVDSIREADESANPELTRFLTGVMLATKFDLRQFQRIVANTRAYGRQCGLQPTPGAPYDFAGPLLRRMSAEQVWDSMVTLAVPDVDSKISFKGPDASDYSATPAAAFDSDELIESVKETAREMANEKLKEMRKHTRPNKEELYAPSPEYRPDRLVRASELPQPTPEGHFLQVFGQSNREVSDGGWRSGTVPQTLLMLNSTLFDVLVKRDSTLARAIARGSGDSGRLRAIYLSILGRVPTLEEGRIIASTFNGTGNVEAIAHTLLGTRQFLFVQ